MARRYPRTGRTTAEAWHPAHVARIGSLAVVLVVLAAAASGCAQDGSGSGPPAALHAWPTAAPALPPPDPSAFASARPQAPSPPPAPAAQAPAAPAGAPSDAEVARELRRALGASGSASTRALVDAATVRADGLATAPRARPARVADIIRGGNEVASKPYVYGGGHGRGETWIDTAYDCSGSVSFALATAGSRTRPWTPGRSLGGGSPGPGRWVTIFANAGHAFMTVAGLRFDTSGRRGTGSRWQTEPRRDAGFTVRHPPGCERPPATQVPAAMRAHVRTEAVDVRRHVGRVVVAGEVARAHGQQRERGEPAVPGQQGVGPAADPPALRRGHPRAPAPRRPGRGRRGR